MMHPICARRLPRPAVARGWILIVAMLLAGATAARADEAVAPADAAAIRQVIQGQMEAFRSDNWSAAFAFASPGIQSKFQSPQVFSRMVTEAYQPVYRPRGVQFREVQAGESGPTQEVVVLGPERVASLRIFPSAEAAAGSDADKT